jgi:hypothetical protein
MMFQRPMHTTMVLSCVIATTMGCQGEASEGKTARGDVATSDKATAAAPGQRSGADRNACDLLTVAEVSAVVGGPVTARETNRETGRSDCQWDGADGVIRFKLVGYWTGGKESWDVLAGSRGMAKDIIQKQEGVGLDSIVKTGPVSGLGDKAVFSPLLESLVLKDNVLLEFTTSLLPKPEAQFRPLAMKALSRL